MTLSPEAIERRASRLIDHLDLLLLTGAMSQKAYDAAMRELDAWAEAKYREGANARER